MTTGKEVNGQQKNHRKLSQSDRSALARIVVIPVMLILATLIFGFRKIAGSLGLPDEYVDNFWIWFGSFCILNMLFSFIIYFTLLKKIDSNLEPKQLGGDSFLEAQTKERQILAMRLGFWKHPSEEIDNQDSVEMFRGIYKQRAFNMGFGTDISGSPRVVILFTETETGLSIAEGLSLGIWMDESQIRRYVYGGETGEIEFDNTADNPEIIQELLGPYGFKWRFVELGAYYIAANHGKLLIKFSTGMPNLSLMRDFLDLTKEVAEKIETFTKEHHPVA